jgi:hypothetical protein
LAGAKGPPRRRTDPLRRGQAAPAELLDRQGHANVVATQMDRDGRMRA